ncbi:MULTISPECIES: phospholipase D family protein [unclassified Exiguobacterium]|uniref:phospholipase D family protein n=1 Tax=unclassified Exiguobacterium TaxID=2644629 RepID=UPI001BEAF716|nr:MULTISPECIES: phospholipase D family protein [unclassified Exiguobacterium]
MERPKRKKGWVKWGLAAFALLFLITMIYHQVKPLPDGVSRASEPVTISDDQIDFLYDLTYQGKDTEVNEQEIFQDVERSIREAREYIVMDFFLFNPYSNEDRQYPDITASLSSALLEQMKAYPDMNVVLITDEINTTYNGHASDHLDVLKEAGAEIVYTNLDALRDPNILYSTLYRIGFQWFGDSQNGWLPNPMAKSAPDITIRSYLRLLNVKANHRKVMVTENDGFVLSANPHDASGYHSNVGVRLDGPILADILEGEEAIATFSKGDAERFPSEEKLANLRDEPSEGPMQIRYVTESKIQDAVIKAMEEAESGETIWIGMFYLADRNIIQAIHEAAERGVFVKLILDPNTNAFGRDKSGLPNLPVAAELNTVNPEQIEIRWYEVGEEQYHPKMLYVEGDRRVVVIGSGNYTTRNMNDYNLEADVEVVTTEETAFIREVDGYFKRLWNNEQGTYTLAYDEIQTDLPIGKYVIYWIQKLTWTMTY